MPRDEFVKRARIAGDPSDKNLFRIAILHHHPVPIPYDHSAESMMVLDNAGAFLKEVSNQNISLILHGHKHHQYFSRISIDPLNECNKETELAVLSAGTVTKGENVSKFDYGFNILQVARNHSVYVKRYEASGGTFQIKDDFTVELDENRRKRRFSKAAEHAGRFCETLVIAILINEDGDSYVRREYQGFSIKKPFNEIPDNVLAFSHGHIELFEAGCLDGTKIPGLTLNVSKKSIRSHTGIISFKQILDNQNDICFFTHFYGNNAFAMNQTQHREMHDQETHDRRNRTEFLIFNLLDTPLRHARLVVSFPHDFTLSMPAIDVCFANSEHYHKAKEAHIATVTYPGMVIVSLSYPEPSARYRLTWALPSKKVQGINKRFQNIINQLLELNSNNTSLEYENLLDIIRITAEEHFELDENDKNKLEVAILIYDFKKKCLNTCLANYPSDDERWRWSFKYGNGISGRTFKTGRPTVFRKSLLEDNKPHHYLFGDESAVQKIDDIPEEILLAIPLGLSHIENPSHYGVLRLSTKLHIPKLAQGLEDDVRTTLFARAANKFCYEILNKIPPQPSQ